MEITEIGLNSWIHMMTFDLWPSADDRFISLEPDGFQKFIKILFFSLGYLVPLLPSTLYFLNKLFMWKFHYTENLWRMLFHLSKRKSPCIQFEIIRRVRDNYIWEYHQKNFKKHFKNTLNKLRDESWMN